MKIADALSRLQRPRQVLRPRGRALPRRLRRWERLGAGASCRIGYVETTRAVDRVSGPSALERFRVDWASFNVVEVNMTVAEDAAELAIATGLRALDAIHLAAAMVASRPGGHLRHLGRPPPPGRPRPRSDPAARVAAFVKDSRDASFPQLRPRAGRHPAGDDRSRASSKAPTARPDLGRQNQGDLHRVGAAKRCRAGCRDAARAGSPPSTRCCRPRPGTASSATSRRASRTGAGSRSSA